MYTVKSAYHMALSRSSSNEASVSDFGKIRRCWEGLWNSKVYPRAKICVWKILNNILPTSPNLQRLGIDSNPLCVLCRKYQESSNHLFWDCKVSKQIWLSFIPPSISFSRVAGGIGLSWTTGIGSWVILLRRRD